MTLVGRSDSCGFCHGGPVGNAATWSDGKPRLPAACPRCGRTAGSPDDLVADILAAAFHAHYEELAPHFGYVTREESRKTWGDVPEHNRALMRATIRALLDAGLIATDAR